MRKNTAIYTGLGLVFIIAAALNYNALQHYAYNKAQVNYWLSFGVPILVDTFIAIAAYIALINREQGESTTLAKGIVIAFTLASVYLNSLHYPLTIYGLSMAALVPTVVFLSIELALQQMEIRHRRDETIQSIQKLQVQAQEGQMVLARIEAEKMQLTEAKTTEIQQFEAKIAARLEQLQAVNLEIEQARIELEETKKTPLAWDSREAHLLRLDGMLAAGIGFGQAAQIFDVAPNTVRNWAKNLNGNSLSNGQVVKQ
ncbi:MAG: hypothetical protein FOGNACKC_04209 [Anaerolineae bacterium]|nr:hypothetical protein [Anaerolineae bacterium]